MFGFLITDALARVLAAAGVTKDRAIAIAEEEGAAHPEWRPFADAVRERIRKELDPALNADVLGSLVESAIDEFRSKHPGYNKHHHGGG